MADKAKLPTELATDLCAAVFAEKGSSGKHLAEQYDAVFEKILECRKKEDAERNKVVF